MLKIGIIGAGRMGTCHAEALKSVDDAYVHGVYDPAAETVKAFAVKFGVKKIYSSSSELAGDKELDGVLVCNFTDQHHDTMVELLDGGKKNIFCEKGLVRKLEDGDDLLRRVKKAGARVLVGHHRRHTSGYARIKQLLEEGVLGRPLMAKVALSHPGYSRQWGDFFADFERSGGVALDMMSHLFDLTNWFFGEPVRASGQSLMFDRSLEMPVDYLSGTVTYGNGVICNIDGSWQRYGPAYDKIEVYGDKATAVFEGGDKLRVYRKNEHTEMLVGSVNAYYEQMKNFADMIIKGVSPKTSLLDGFNAVKVALALIESAKTNKTVKI